MDTKFLDAPEYKFLKENEHLGDRIGMLYLGGSISYGTNLPGKGDIDLRGFSFERKEELIGYKKFEEIVEPDTDTTIYSFNKFISLLEKCNPNIIESLGCKEEHYFKLSDTARFLIDNSDMFLSQIAYHSFGGYASQQLARLENALSLNSLSEKKKLEHLLRSLEAAIRGFVGRFKPISYDFSRFMEKKEVIRGENGFALYVSETDKNIGEEILIDINLEAYPVKDLNSIFGEMSNIVKTYNKLNGRNKKKDEEHLDKHAMHLVRLYYMAFDILEKGKIVTFRENEREELVDIRLGKYRQPDGSYRQEFFEYRDALEKRLHYAKANSVLPELPDKDKIEEFVIQVNEKIVKGII